MTVVEALISGVIGALIVAAAIFFFSRLTRTAEDATRANDIEGRMRVLIKWVKEDYERRLVPRGTGKGLAGTNEDPGFENEMFAMPGTPFTPSTFADCPTRMEDASCQGLRIRQRNVITDPATNASSFTLRQVEWSTQCVAESQSPVDGAKAPDMPSDLTCAAAGQRPQIVRSFTVDTSKGDPPTVKGIPELEEEWLHSASLCFRMVPDCARPTIPRTIEASVAFMYRGTARAHVLRDSFVLTAEERNPTIEKIPP